MANVLVNAPKTAKRGSVVEIKALILHPMETGFRPGTMGKIIPRNIIERFTATWNGTEIFELEMSPAIVRIPEIIAGRQSASVGVTVIPASESADTH